MQIYLVWSDEYEDASIEGVFSSQELAENFVHNNWKEWYRRCWIETGELDDEDTAYSKFEHLTGWDIIGYDEDKELKKWGE